jgi:hypothetical protein
MKKFFGGGGTGGSGMIGKLVAEAETREAEGMTPEEKKKREKAEGQKAGTEGRAPAYAKGGYVRAADGCAKKGKTKGKMV